MKNNEKKTIALLFLLVVLAFSFAQRDSQKIVFLYNNKANTTKVTAPAPQPSTIVKS